MQSIRKNEKVIVLDNVTVRYRAPEIPIRTFKEYIIHLVQGKVRYKEFLALNEINLQINRGEILGIIGRNGAGKSTLLKVISRVLAPTEGRLWIKGRVSPLLGLGAGFHPELTGRENIFLNGTLLGHSHSDIEKHLEDIIEFSELGNFVNAPLRSYSSGMVTRLGFAVATTWEPEILLLDEVLAVGDEAFRRKCQDRMESFRNNSGTTILIVSHQMNTIRGICDRVVWIDNGSIRSIGTVNDVINAYRNAQ
jgi:ABC-2 type transport system ATP-binding protein/lipopolysaccharide transport system ATP-binding protein